MIRRPRRSTLFPYTTLSRSAQAGRMFLTRLTAALSARGTQPKDQRHPTSVIIDEAHVVAGPGLAGLYAQARKFHASITLADRKSTRLNSSHSQISYAVFCLK